MSMGPNTEKAHELLHRIYTARGQCTDTLYKELKQWVLQNPHTYHLGYAATLAAIKAARKEDT